MFSGLLLTAVIFLSVCSCASREEEPDIIIRLEPEFVVDLFETRNPADGSPVFGLWMESRDTFDCADYRIDAQVDVSVDAVNVRILGVQKPLLCSGAPDRVRDFVGIGPLANGVYAFQLQLGEPLVNKGILTVQDGRYSLDIPEPAGIDLQNRVLQHIPDGYAWGYVVRADESVKPAADNFIQELKTLTTEPGLPPGYYGYFTVTGTNSLFFHKSWAPVKFSELFLRRMTAPPAALRNSVQGFRNAAQHPLEIKCLTTAGDL